MARTITEALVALGRSTLDALLPAVCLGCRAPARLEIGLCHKCRERVERLRPRACCERCGRPLAAPAAAPLPRGYACGGCRRAPPAYDRLLWFFPYAPPFDAVIQALKFRGLEFLGRHLAATMLAELRRPARGRPRPETASVQELSTMDAVVPVPLHWRRRLVRGYNQAESIARPLATGLGVPLRRALSRTRATRPQTAFNRLERASNLTGAFVPRPHRPRSPLAGARLILVDDVVTTGATMQAAAATLRQAGAVKIVAIAAARTDENAPPAVQPRADRAIF